MYSKKQRIAAILAVIVILLFFIATLIAAIIDRGGRLFQGLLFADIALPILAWIYIWLFGKLTGRKTIADFDQGQPQKDADLSEAAEDTSVTLSKNPLLRNDPPSKG